MTSLGHNELSLIIIFLSNNAMYPDWETFFVFHDYQKPHKANVMSFSMISSSGQIYAAVKYL